MHSNNLELKNTLFFKLEIQEKILQMVGILPLEEALPINGSFIEDMMREESHDDAEDDEYEDEVEYFVVQTDKLIKKTVEKTICKQLSNIFECDIIVKSEPWKGEQKLQTLYLSIETNKQAATITTYKFNVDTSNKTYTLYPTTKSLKDLVSKFVYKITKILLQIATKCEYSGLKIVSIIYQTNILIICFQLGEAFIHGRISISKQINTEQQIYNFEELYIEIKQKLIISILQNLCKQPKDIQINCNRKENLIIQVEGKDILTYQIELFDFRKEMVLAHELHYTFGITLRSPKDMNSNTLIFTATKQRIYIRNIIRLVSLGLQRQSTEMQQIYPYLIKIAKQSDPKQIINIFNTLYKQIVAKSLTKIQNISSNNL